jgi:hypothetical protein
VGCFVVGWWIVVGGRFVVVRWWLVLGLVFGDGDFVA